METNINREIRNYLNQVKQNIGHLPTARRETLLNDLESHINEALKQRVKSETPSEEDVKAVIAEMDPPDSFKQIGDDSEQKENSFVLGKLALGIALVGVILSWMPYLQGYLAYTGLSLQAVAFIIGICTWRNPYSKIAVVLSFVLFCIWIVINTATVVV